MYNILIFSVIALATLMVLIINKERSFLYIAGLVVLCAASFWIAYVFAQPLILGVMVILVSLYVAWLARDELRMGRRWFFALVTLSVIATLFFIYLNNRPEAYASSFVGLGAFVALLLSYRTSWTKTKGQWESRV